MNWNQQLPDRTRCADSKRLDARRAFPADGISRASDAFEPAIGHSSFVACNLLLLSAVPGFTV